MPGLGFLVSTVDNAAMMQRRRVDELWRSRDFRALVFLGVLGVLTLILAVAIRGILGPFILAGILAMMLNPAVNAAERRRVPRLGGLLALYGIIAAVLAAAVYFLAPIVTQEFSSLVAQGPAIASYFQDLADKDHVVSVLGIPIDLRQAYNDAVRNLPALLAGHLSSVVENVFMLVNWIFQTILVLLVAFFLAKDARIIRRFFRDLVPQGYRTDAHEVAADVYRMLGAYMRGELVICSLIGLVTGMALWIVGVPYSLALGIVAGVTAFIPFIGPFLGALPAVDRILVLGDIVGYGPDPLGVIDRLQSVKARAVRGNHDQAMLDPSMLELFNPQAAAAARWTLDVMTPQSLRYLNSLPFYGRIGRHRLVHGSPRKPYIWEYILDELQALEILVRLGARYCFFGHTHLPRIFTESGEQIPEGTDWIEVPSSALVNPGSVGQPRD